MHFALDVLGRATSRSLRPISKQGREIYDERLLDRDTSPTSTFSAACVRLSDRLSACLSANCRCELLQTSRVSIEHLAFRREGGGPSTDNSVRECWHGRVRRDGSSRYHLGTGLVHTWLMLHPMLRMLHKPLHKAMHKLPHRSKSHTHRQPAVGPDGWRSLRQ